MIDRNFFFDHARANPFAGALGQSQVDGMNVILDQWEKLFNEQTDVRWLGYAFGTSFHETAKTMQPIEEYGKGRGRAYGVPAGPWHCVYDGRGDVQLTWFANYVKATKRLHELNMLDPAHDLAREPDLAMRPEIAAPIMLVGMNEGWFTSKKFSDYFNPQLEDQVNARRIINGTD